MKKILIVIAFAGVLAACNNGNTNQTKTDSAFSVSAVDSVSAIGADTATTKSVGVTADTATLPK